MIELPFSLGRPKAALTVPFYPETRQPKPSMREMVRNPLEQRIPDAQYAKHFEVAVEWVAASIDQYLDSPEKFYLEFFPTVHRIMIEGSPAQNLREKLNRDMKQLYLGQSSKMQQYLEPGRYRDDMAIATRTTKTSLRMATLFSEVFNDDLHEFLQTGKRYMPDETSFAPTNPGYLETIPGGTRYVYPGNEHVKPAVEEMRKALGAVNRAPSPEEKLQHLADFMYMVKFHPFPAVNNSVYHAILQAVSRKNGLHLMPHMNLDEMAQLLSKTVFSLCRLTCCVVQDFLPIR